MAFINPKTKEVQIKIVYYGPGMGGKTTNLEYVYSKYTDRIKSQIVSLKTQGDRTIFFDFMPFDLGDILGYTIKIQLYTVPGQVRYNATRRVVLRGVDGVVFVADATKAVREKNILSLKNLHENLEAYNKSIHHLPMVFQYNKMDLAEHGVPLLSFDRLQKDLNFEYRKPAFPASALKGINVVHTMKKISTLTLPSVQKNLKKEVMR